MEDFRVDVIVGKGPGATAIPLEVAPFTLVGATTRAGLLTGPLRDRFGFTGAHGVLRAGRAGAVLAPLARACSASTLDRRRRRRDRRPIPRHAPHRQPAAAPGPGLRRGARRRRRRPRDRAGRAGRVRRRRPRAWTGWTGRCWTRWCAASAAGRSASSTLAVAVGEEPETVEEVCEPFLVRAGLLARTPRGRVATAAAWPHLGLEPAAGSPGRPRRPPGLVGDTLRDRAEPASGVTRCGLAAQHAVSRLPGRLSTALPWCGPACRELRRRGDQSWPTWCRCYSSRSR